MTFSLLVLHGLGLAFVAAGLQIALWFLTLLSNGASDWNKAELALNQLALKSSGMFYLANTALWISYLFYAYLDTVAPAYLWLYASQSLGLFIFSTITRNFPSLLLESTKTTNEKEFE